jgi:hypothetical protein
VYLKSLRISAQTNVKRMAFKPDVKLAQTNGKKKTLNTVNDGFFKTSME